MHRDRHRVRGLVRQPLIEIAISNPATSIGWRPASCLSRGPLTSDRPDASKKAVAVLTEARNASSLERKLRLIFRPIDDFEKHSALEHFRIEIRSGLLPVGRLADAKSGFPSLRLSRIIRCQGATHALVHQGEAVVRERLIIQWDPQPYE